MSDHIVFDCEIANCVGENGLGWNDTDRLGLSCCCVWEVTTRRMRVYGPYDLAALQQRLLDADRITGFNVAAFDMPLCFSVPKNEWRNHPAYPLLLPKTDDILRRIWLALGLNPDTFGPAHKGWSLDNVAGSTLNRRKTGNGADAPKWFQRGEWARLVDYCLNDVALERDLGEFIDAHGFCRNEYAKRDASTLLVPPWKPETLPVASEESKPTNVSQS